MNATNEKVTVWYDGTSQDNGWIVDTDDDGSSQTVRVFETEAEAREFAQQFAAARGLTLAD